MSGDVILLTVSLRYAKGYAKGAYGHLHMGPVDRAGSVSEISPYL